jgi:hypothetical protein
MWPPLESEKSKYANKRFLLAGSKRIVLAETAMLIPKGAEPIDILFYGEKGK